MAFVIADRVRETTTTIGTGSVTLGGAYTSFQTFSAAIGNGNNTYYTIASAATGEWEVGIGTYSSGPNSLSRDTVLASSAGGAKVSFSVGSKDVFVTQPAERSLLLQSGGSGLFAGNAAFTANGLLYANATTTATTSSNLTFDGTALTLGGNPTLSAGTANGVAYLNGSKVLTTGSALTFDGTNLGVGNSSPTYSLDLNSATVDSSTLGLRIFRGGVSTNWSRIDNISGVANFRQYDSTTPIFIWSTSTNGSTWSEQMRLTSTGLGIGTSSITAGTKLDVNGAVYSRGDIYVNATSAFITDINGGYGLKIVGGGSGSVAIQTNGSIKATYDASGNLGLGVTPSAWSATSKAIQLAASSSLEGRTNDGSHVALYANATWNGTNFIYQNTATASYYRQSSSVHSWHIAGVGTAGNAISFTQAMTLDASGNLAVGTTSAATYRARIYGGNGKTLLLDNDASQYTELWFANNGTTKSVIGFNNSTSDIAFLNTATGGSLLLGTNGSERLRIDASGNLGLGVAPSAWGSAYKALDANTRGISLAGGTESGALSVNAYWNSGWKYAGTSTYRVSQYQQFDGAHSWFTAPSGTAGNAISFTQAMTLDASGQLGIGTTSPGFTLDISAVGPRIRQTATAGTNSSLIQLVNTGGTAYIGLDNSSGGISTAYALNFYHSGAYPIVFSTSGSERARITSTGNFVAGGSVALATNATDGFLYVPTCAGTPTGTPTAITGMAPIVVNTTNNKLYFYSGGAWRDAGP